MYNMFNILFPVKFISLQAKELG